MSPASSSVAVSDQFPAGLRVLVVDDDPTWLLILEKMLRKCLYEVTKCNRAEIALDMLRRNKNGYDIVISDVHMPDMDGFKLLEQVGLEMDLPVIMMSEDGSKQDVMEGVTHGACDYLLKPIRTKELRNIWQHVAQQPKPFEESDDSYLLNQGNWRTSNTRKDEEEEAEKRYDTSTLKKPRVVWSVELHQQFVSAVIWLGIDEAVPKKILELINVPGLTRENVASHLQKYRLYLRRLSGVSPHQGNSFISSHSQEPPYGSLSSLSGLDFQTLAATGQIPAQSLATLQAAGLARSATKPGLPMPLVDQRNIFSFDNQKLRFGEGQPQHMSSGKQMNLLHGIPTTMDSKQLVNLHHSAQSLGSLNMSAHGNPSGQSSPLLMQMAQPQSRGQILTETTGGQVPRLPTSVGHPILSNGAAGAMLARNGIGENSRGTGYNSVSQTSSVLNFPLNHSAELPGNTFPLGSTPGISAGMSTLTTKGGFQEEINSDIKGSGGFMPSYDIFNDLQQHKPHNWELQNVGFAFDASQHSNSLQASVDVTPSVLVNQGYSSSQRNVQNSNVSAMGKPIFSVGEGIEHGNALNVGQHLNSLLVDNSTRVKTERVTDTSCQPTLLPQRFGQEDLMSAILKQQQDGLGPAENDFEFDGYSLDNIPV